ncbi:MAG: putative molybdenum carrier protein [Deltaproteobacteria bacterium]|nr:putative molybdenum carrier protein [Deltaproteobacteria bacterium]
MVGKIISGGQTGADRAALDFALERNIAHGGWIPRGRKAEDGKLPEKYRLKEMDSTDYARRTEQNVIDADATLIFSHGKLTGGSLLTGRMALKNGRPWLHVDLLQTSRFSAAQSIHAWIKKQHIGILNVAGSRQSQNNRIYRATFDILEATFQLSMSIPA